MRGYLLDTDALSMFAPGRKPARDGVADWFHEKSDLLFLSTISIGEVEAGLSKLRRDGASARALRLGEWFERLLRVYADRILPFDRDIAHLYGATLDRALASGHNSGFADAGIAATAARHDLVIVTRNIRHFRLFEAPVINPDDLDSLGH